MPSSRRICVACIEHMTVVSSVPSSPRVLVPRGERIRSKGGKSGKGLGAALAEAANDPGSGLAIEN